MTFYLDDDVLGRLDLECADGFVVAEFAIGWPEVRSVVRNLALADGVQDDTTYLGGRAVTVALRLDSNVLPTQDLLDVLLPYVSPRRRPRLVYAVQRPVTDPSHVRSFTLRGADAPVVIDAPKHPVVVVQWVTTSPFAFGPDQLCAVATLSGTEEDGRAYNLTFDRTYPFSAPFGITYFTVEGNAPTDWVGTLTAELEDPLIEINGVGVQFTGLTLTAGQTVIIDTAARTILRNGDPNDSVFGLSNFTAWTWDELRLSAGTNTILLQGANPVGDPSFTLCYYPHWF